MPAGKALRERQGIVEEGLRPGAGKGLLEQGVEQTRAGEGDEDQQGAAAPAMKQEGQGQRGGDERENAEVYFGHLSGDGDSDHS